MTNKLKYFVGNWKMFGDFASLKIIYKINRFCIQFSKKHRKNKIVFCIPNTLIHFYTKKLKSKFISIGAQNCHHESSYGSFTGSENATMLKNAGANYVILGHSENRLEGDTNVLIKKKIESSLNKKLNIIFCIGETLKEKKSGKTFLVLKKQLRMSLNKNFNFSRIIIGYEPIWSIGTGKIPKPNDLKRIFAFIKKEYKKISKTKSSPNVLYGGSVTPKNVRMFSFIDEIDGFLIGGASQSANKFIDIIKNYYK